MSYTQTFSPLTLDKNAVDQNPLRRGATEDIGNWGEPLGLASLFVETITVWVTVRGAVEMHHRK